MSVTQVSTVRVPGSIVTVSRLPTARPSDNSSDSGDDQTPAPQDGGAVGSPVRVGGAVLGLVGAVVALFAM